MPQSPSENGREASFYCRNRGVYRSACSNQSEGKQGEWAKRKLLLKETKNQTTKIAQGQSGSMDRLHLVLCACGCTWASNRMSLYILIILTRTITTEIVLPQFNEKSSDAEKKCWIFTSLSLPVFALTNSKDTRWWEPGFKLSHWWGIEWQDVRLLE